MTTTTQQKLEEILKTVYMNGVESAQHGIYIELPNVKALNQLSALITEECNKARLESRDYFNKRIAEEVRIARIDELEALRKAKVKPRYVHPTKRTFNNGIIAEGATIGDYLDNRIKALEGRK